MTINITVNFRGQQLVLQSEAHQPVSVVLRKHKLLNHPCGGNGTCGKCFIIASTTPTEAEIQKIDAASLAQNVRLACYTKASEGLEITIPKQEHSQVLTSFSKSVYSYSPLIESRSFIVDKASLDNQKSDLQNIMDSCGARVHNLGLDNLARLPEYLRSRDRGTALLMEDTLVSFSESNEHLLLTVDIGTTTIAVMLIDLNTQEIIETAGEHNRQASFGDDVISRINHTIENGSQGIQELQQTIVGQINVLKETLLKRAREKGRECSDTSMISITGNTSMIHILCGLPPINISRAPFVPVTLEALHLNPGDIGIDSNGSLFILPGISSYVGPDIVASLISANAHVNDTPFLLVDFGTNAEIVLGTGFELHSCSTAAGPCFEGATLSCGTVAKDGAIDTVFATEEGFSYSTIGDGPAIGLCGSAVVDCIALLLKSGDIDETGRMEGNGNLSDFIVEIDGHPAFMLTDKVYLSQEDVRKIQLAKAAVRAGIETLIKDSNFNSKDIVNLYLAGGFGSALNGESAVRIGLVPADLKDKICVLGNAASQGAMRYVTEEHLFSKIDKLKKRTNYIELSAHLEFTNEYVTQMMFPEDGDQVQDELEMCVVY